MSDSRLRELERRWTETGSVEDEAAYLQERVRAGDLRDTKLELAANCGYKAARIAFGLNNPAQISEDRLRLELWVRNLICEREGEHEVFVRAAIAAAQSVIDIWEQYYNPSTEPQLAITAATDCFLNPSQDNIDTAITAAEDAYDVAATDLRATTIADVQAARTAAHAAFAANSAARAAACVSEASSTKAVAYAAAAGNAACAPAETAGTATYAAIEASCIEDVQKAISEALTPWALGYSDPLRESVDAPTSHPPRT